MKLIRKITAVLVTMAIAFSFAACSSAKADISVDALTKAAKKYGAEERTDYKDMGIMTSRNAKPETIYYVAKDKDEATVLFKGTLGRMDFFPKYDLSAFAFAGSTEIGSDEKAHTNLIFLMVFADAKTADEAHELLKETYCNSEDAQTGTKGDYSYEIKGGEAASGTRKLCKGIYKQGNAVLYIEGQAAIKDSFKFDDSICRELGIISPSKAKFD